MAVPFTFFTSGPSVVTFDSEQLGFCEDRVQVNVQPFFEDLHADSWGGIQGGFADRQLLGAVANISCLITKGDADALNALTSFDSGGAAGILPVLGSFVYQDNLFGILDIEGTNETLQFDKAHISMAIELNQSMRHRRFQVGFTARLDDECTRVLMQWNSGISCLDDD